MSRKWVTAAAVAAAVLVTSGTAVAEDGPSAGPVLPDVPADQAKKPQLLTGQDVQQADGTVADVALKVLRDGTLSVTEKVTVPGGKQLTSRVPLKVPASDDQDRVFRIRDVKTEGAATSQLTGDQLVLTFSGGTSAVTYTVDGAIADQSGRQQARWQVGSGFDAPLDKLTASFIAPSPQLSPVDCFAGPLGSSQRCTLAELDHTGVVRLEQNDVRPGDRVDLLVGLPANTTPANAKFAGIGLLATAFALTPLTGIVFALLLAFLVAGGIFVWRRRKQDAGALLTATGPVEVLLRDGDRVFFASPDGVLPGQVGTVVDETVDVVDISATVVDLAVRNYLWLAEVPGHDWQIARRNPPDEHLHDFERAVCETLLPAGTDSVLVSQLRARGGLDLRRISDAMYADVVTKRWFSRRPDTARGRLTWLGAGIFALGLAATAVLTFTVGDALLGVAVALAGLAVAAAAALLPSRTARGRVLAGQVRGLLDYLHTAKADDIPPADRELVFSRSLPYAVVLGDTERWLGTFAGLNPASDGSAGLYWYGGMEAESDLRRFGSHFPSFLTALDGLLTESGRAAATR
ncbi:DUF2207 domain-containing protein [Amycolatopsis balhimycina DSM 5908]|uniref:DUF2207 domain-containing protein n=1 Tax=Amycolatopsis balhimycina DSM 5908 TaxID=1081091 RepID=A0A428W2I0_AMYBA|nr:DUF2207 domain-containing protein [Amycolatopsis balhimycina]RSM37253.1 DUF2207 domain-containing protein [Amycolatopsis balhimycina DSM 5908]